MKSLIGALFILVVLSSALAQVEPGPFEKRMHKLYQSSYSTEVSDAEWAQYVSNLGFRSYQVSPGDTLWGLSTVFFGDGHYWSKIWSYNRNLTNPHLISVGQNIEFFTGSIDLPPSLTVGGSGKDPEVINGDFKEVRADGQIEQLEGETPQQAQMRQKKATQLYPGAPSLPAPRQSARPVMENLPSVFKDDTGFDQSKYGTNGISMDVRPPTRVNPEFVAQTFFYDGDAKDYPRIGVLVEPEDDHLLVGQNNQVYIRADAAVAIGDELTIMGKEYDYDRNGVSGDVIRFLGHLKVTDKLDNQIYRGYVKQNLGEIKYQSWVTREKIPVFKNNYDGRPSAQKLQIVGGGVNNAARVFGTNDVVFLNGGTREGLRVGDVLGVYKRRDIRYNEPEIAVSPTPIGHLKVYRAEPRVASAYVIGASDAILLGDETGAPSIVSGVASKSEKEDLNDIESGLDFSEADFGNEDTSFEEELNNFEFQ